MLAFPYKWGIYSYQAQHPDFTQTYEHKQKRIRDKARYIEHSTW
jgi:hypothetical protein